MRKIMHIFSMLKKTILRKKNSNRPDKIYYPFYVFILLLTSSHIHAQDRRTVTEPTAPHILCATYTPASTVSLQSALDSCPEGSALRLSAGHYESGPLIMPSGVFLWLDQGSVLGASTNPARYDQGRNLCGTIDVHGHGCRPFILFSQTTGGGIFGPGIIDGNGGHPMTDTDETWWHLARRAQREDGKQNVPRLIVVQDAQNITFAHLTLRNSPNFHITLDHVSGATFWDVRIDTPEDARNTDGIDPGSSEDITIAHSFIRTGDDNVAIKAGQNGPSRYISVLDNHFYAGHGMSIGSETFRGVSHILVRNLTLDGTTAGLRIKSDSSRGGLVDDVHYDHICLRHNAWPIMLDTHYDPHSFGFDTPEYRHILLSNIHGEDGILLIHGTDASNPIEATLSNVFFSGPAAWDVQYATITQENDSVFPPVKETSTQPHPAQYPCADQWVPFPTSPQ